MAPRHPHHGPDPTGNCTHRIGGYREHRPPADLSRVVDVLWRHRAPSRRLRAYPGYLVVPDPGVSLCFACHRRPDGTVEDPRLLLIGPVRRSRAYRPEPAARMEAVRIFPEWCRALLGTDPRDHVDALDDYGGVRPDRGAPLLERLAATRNAVASRDLLLEFLRDGRRRRAPAGTTLLAHRGLRRIRRERRPSATRGVAESLGISGRHLRRLVSDVAGLSPGAYAGVERFLGVVRQADAAERPDWVRLAARHGYADQSHLSREVRRLSGLPPARLHAERRRPPASAGAACG